MRKFYNTFPIRQTVSAELSWSHYLEIIKIDEEDKRNFYLKETVNSNWSVRELQRQKNSLLYERLKLSKNKEKVKELSLNGLLINDPNDLVKDPYVLEFLNIKENGTYLKTDLEKAIIKHLKDFLLELGKGYSFIGNQHRIKIGDEYFYIDLLFYNRLAKCFVIIDLKLGKLTHGDLGQMQMYVNYYKRTQMVEGENEPIGILLCADKNDAVVKFTLPEDNKNIYASKYKLYIPTEEELINEIKKEQVMFNLENRL
jgi:predicted nuclease of restriction endonuclease-like (RecB) superfamily